MSANSERFDPRDSRVTHCLTSASGGPFVTTSSPCPAAVCPAIRLAESFSQKNSLPCCRMHVSVSRVCCPDERVFTPLASTLLRRRHPFLSASCSGQTTALLVLPWAGCLREHSPQAVINADREKRARKEGKRMLQKDLRDVVERKRSEERRVRGSDSRIPSRGLDWETCTRTEEGEKDGNFSPDRLCVCRPFVRSSVCASKICSRE